MLAYLIKTVGGLTLPLCAEIGGFVVIWLYIGHIFRMIEGRHQENDKKVAVMLVLAIISFAAVNYVSCILYPGLSDSYRQLYFPNVFLSLLTGLSGTLMLVCVAKLITNNSALEFLGRNSNTIYGLHFLLLGIIGQVMKRLPLYSEIVVLYVIAGTIINIGCISCYIAIKNKSFVAIKNLSRKSRRRI